MLKLAQVPDQDRHAHVAEAPRAPRVHHLYYAFLSYSHQDEAIADWLHDELEQFKVPHKLVGKLTVNGVIPNRLAPIFRDRHELAAADDLATEIKAALAASRFLVVMCSPAAARSHWTNAEIETFKRSHPEGCVLGAIVDGEPFASEIPGREDEECFPPALRQRFDRRGRPTGKRAEPLAADLRESGDGRRMGFLKLVAGMLGVGLDDLVHREQTRRQRRVAWLVAASLGGMAVTTTLAVTAIQSRDAARDQRREAEGLVAFMLGDLKDKLEPIGRLDVLDGVGSRVLSYYRKQDTAQLSDNGLAQRSRALTLMGQIARDRGDLNKADALYRQAYAGTVESIRRDPNDPQRLYDHAQNAFYLAEIAVRRGRLDTAENLFREYTRLAGRMVALQPDSIKWRTEAQFAAANLGFVLFSKRHFSDAAEQYARALATVEAFAAADPDNNNYQAGVADALALVADAQEADGKLTEAVQTRMRHVALLGRLVPRMGADAHSRLILAHRDLGRLYSERGSGDLALQEFRSAADEGARLLAVEPRNTKWLDWTQSSRLMLALQLFEQGDVAEAANQAPSICSTFKQLVAQNSTMALRRAGLRDCLILRARLSARSGRAQEAAAFAAQAVQTAKSVKTTDGAADQFGVAQALRILGDVRAGSGDPAGARSAWMEANNVIPRDIAEKPQEMDEHAIILARVGRATEAATLKNRLAQIGYRQSELRIG